MMRLSLAILWLSFSMSGCVYRLTVSAADGERLIGRYRFGRDDTGLVQLIGPGGEVLMGRLFRVPARLLSKVTRRPLARARSRWTVRRYLFQAMASPVFSEIVGA